MTKIAIDMGLKQECMTISILVQNGTLVQFQLGCDGQLDRPYKTDILTDQRTDTGRQRCENASNKRSEIHFQFIGPNTFMSCNKKLMQPPLHDLTRSFLTRILFQLIEYPYVWIVKLSS